MLSLLDGDLNDIIVFVRVVESGSFTSAAQSLHLPKSSVSRKVSRLESLLGVRLLQRTTRSLTLTAAGHTYFERVSRIVAELEDVHAKVIGLGETPRGPLKLTAPLSFEETGQCLYFDFLNRFPQVNLEVIVTDRYIDIVQEGFDAAIRGGKSPDSSLSGQKILDSHLQLLASRAYLEEYGTPTCPSDLNSHKCLIHGPRSSATWTFSTPRGLVDVHVQGRFASTNMMSLLEAARRDLGIVRVPTGGQRIDLSGLEILLPESTISDSGLWLIYQGNKHLSPALRAFIDFAGDYFS